MCLFLAACSQADAQSTPTDAATLQSPPAVARLQHTNALPDWSSEDLSWMRDSSEYDATRQICTSALDFEPPTEDWPTLDQAKSLEGCSSFDFYHGLGVEQDYEKARHCALVEREEMGRLRAEEQLHSFTLMDGPGMLTMLYANGQGVERDLTIATHMACETSGAPAAVNGRVLRMDERRQQGWSGTDYSSCEDITSGRAGGVCSSFEARLSDYHRDQTLLSLSANWSAPAKQKLAETREAFADYAAQANSMNCYGGTLAGACAIGGTQQMVDRFSARLLALAQKRALPAEPARLRDGDIARQGTATRAATATQGEWDEFLGDLFADDEDKARYQQHRAASIAARRSFEPKLVALMAEIRPDLTSHEIRVIFRDL